MGPERRSRWRARALLGYAPNAVSQSARFPLVVAAVIAVALGLAACGDSGSSQEELDRARTEGAKEARQQAKIEQIERELKAVKKGGGGSTGERGVNYDDGASGGSSTCGSELSVGPSTTCPFAENVRSAYFEELGSGSGTVIAYSPVTNTTYELYCTAGSPHVCTGGNDASVYFP